MIVDPTVIVGPRDSRYCVLVQLELLPKKLDAILPFGFGTNLREWVVTPTEASTRTTAMIAASRSIQKAIITAIRGCLL